MIENFIELDQEKYNKILVVREQRSKLTLHCNGMEFYKILIDNKNSNKIDNKNKKCDYVIATAELKKIIIYTELKGGDLKTAFEQILATHNFLNEKFEKRYTAIAFTGNPQAKSILQHYELKFKKMKFEIPFFVSSGAITLKYILDTQKIDK